MSEAKPSGFTLPDEDGQPDPDEAEAQRRVDMLLGANRAARRADPEGMGADTWRPVL